jgi:hypothetical protein
MKKNIHKPPSREKYEISHPTVSVRVSQQLYVDLMTLCELSGKSLGDILREALKKQAPSVKDAYSNGYNAAKAQYAVTYNCYTCGGCIIIDKANTKKAVAEYMKEHRWGHAECHKNRI